MELEFRDGDHLLAQIDSKSPEGKTLSMKGIPGDRYVTYGICEEGNSLQLTAHGTGEVNTEPFDIECIGLTHRQTVLFYASKASYEYLSVKATGPGYWAVAVGWQEDSDWIQH